MATAPNMNVAPMIPQVGLPPTVDGEGGDLFASLLPIVTGTAAPDAGAPDAASLPVTAGGATIAMPIQQPGTVPAHMLAVDLRPAAPKAEGEEAVTDDVVETDDASALPGTDLLPLLQAQSVFPVTVVTAPAPAPAPAPTATQISAPAPDAPTMVPQAPASPAGTVAQPSASTVPQPPVTLAATPLPVPADNAIVTDDPAIAVAVREAARTLVAEAPKGGSEAPVAAKAPKVTKGDVVQPVKLPADAGTPISLQSAATVGEAVTDRPRSAEKPAAPGAAPVQAATVQAPLAPAAVTPVVVAIDPAVSLQPASAGVGTPQAAPAPDASIMRELDLAHDSEWLDRLARDIARTGANDGPMRFKLHPQTLGHLQVELSQGDHGTSVRLTVETEAARTILADAQPRLMAEARAQGVRISESNVDLAGHGHQAASGDPRRHQDDARQNVLIRTARGSAGEAAETAAPARGRADRYA
jgi:flagellar hook-length control protein FliK